MGILLLLIIGAAISIALIITSNNVKGEGWPYGVPAAILTAFIGVTFLRVVVENKYTYEAMDAVVTTIQHTDKMGKGVDYFEVYGRRVALDRTTKENNTTIEGSPYTIIFKSPTYKGDTVFVYKTRCTPLYGYFTYFGEYIAVYDHPVYAFDREVMLKRSGEPKQIK